MMFHGPPDLQRQAFIGSVFIAGHQVAEYRQGLIDWDTLSRGRELTANFNIRFRFRHCGGFLGDVGRQPTVIGQQPDCPQADLRLRVI